MQSVSLKIVGIGDNMRNYFKEIKKPKWYMLIIAAIIYTWQCMAIISMFTLLGGGYFTVAPIQFVAGLLFIMTYLIVLKDNKQKSFWIFIIASVMCAIISTRLLFPQPFSSVPGVTGVMYGIAVCLTFVTGYFVVMSIIRQLIIVKKQASNRT